MGESGHRFVQYLKRRFPDGNPQLEKELKKLKTVLDGNNQQTRKVSRVQNVVVSLEGNLIC